MAAVIFINRGSVTLRHKNLVGILRYLKSEDITRCNPIRYHHVGADIWKHHRRIQQRGCTGIASSRSISTGLIMDDLGLKKPVGIASNHESISSHNIENPILNEHIASNVNLSNDNIATTPLINKYTPTSSSGENIPVNENFSEYIPQNNEISHTIFETSVLNENILSEDANTSLNGSILSERSSHNSDSIANGNSEYIDHNSNSVLNGISPPDLSSHSSNPILNGNAESVINGSNSISNGFTPSEHTGYNSHAVLNGNVESVVHSSNSVTNGVSPSEPSSQIPSTMPSSPILDNIPEAPALPPQLEELLESLPLSGEPTFNSQGLGGWTPVGFVQNCMEYLHIGCDLPWWTSIVIGTIVVRILIFPLVILAQRNSAIMSNNLPQLQILQLKMSEARQTGNQIEAARYAQELMLFMREKKLNPLRNMIVPLAQAPIFISFFMGLRGMTNVPIESMKMGGLFWFTDLTIPDQYYLLPFITSFTMWVTIEVGTDSAKLANSNMQTMKYVLRALPVVIFPFIINFPGAILVYWTSSNFISLLQVAFLRIPAVRDYFKIERTININPDTLPVKPKPFVAGLKDSWTNIKISRELEDRQRLDELQFQRAGKGPIQKTFKYDPTKPRNQTTNITTEGISAKKREE